ncbi:MAG: DNA integrity scanning diadenylate cyclase DisA [archaeon]|nr:DNA integrity scanning diadenylate cyclase DisA [archaeon]MCR4323643.1 DNA integrity scanning diadenylate cyclase DisA [Nanoarchaeota archaeon]
MVTEKEKTLLDFIKLVSPGKPLRDVIDDLIRSGLGAMIIFDAPTLHSENILEGGFRINSRFTSQKLFELCKMDGAIIVSPDLKRILFANALMNPNASLYTAETGTRHKAAERTAKQANTFVIAVSERKKKVTLYHGESRYFLKETEEILRDLSSTLQVLEKQRELLDANITDLNVLEMSDLVSVSDVCKVIQRAEMILKISDSVKINFTELGREGNVMYMRYKELLKGVWDIEKEILRDYAHISLKKSRTILANLTLEGLLDTDSIARLIIEKSPESSLSPRGFRFLSHLSLSEKEVSPIVKKFGNLKALFDSDSVGLEPILKNRASTTYEEIRSLREQVLSGKVVS